MLQAGRQVTLRTVAPCSPTHTSPVACSSHPRRTHRNVWAARAHAVGRVAPSTGSVAGLFVPRTGVSRRARPRHTPPSRMRPLPHAVSTRAELLHAGLSERQIDYALGTGELRRLRQAVYCLETTWRSADRVTQHRLGCRGARPAPTAAGRRRESRECGGPARTSAALGADTGVGHRPTGTADALRTGDGRDVGQPAPRGPSRPGALRGHVGPADGGRLPAAPGCCGRGRASPTPPCTGVPPSATAS